MIRSSESLFLSQEILNGATLSHPYQSIWFPGDDPGAMVLVRASMLFESVQGRGTVREPRGDIEEYSPGAEDACGEEPIDEEPIHQEPACETDTTLC